MKKLLIAIFFIAMASSLLIAQTEPPVAPSWEPAEKLKSGLKIVKDFELPDSFNMGEFKAGMGTYRFSLRISGSKVIVLEASSKKLFRFSQEGALEEELIDLSEVNEGYPQLLNQKQLSFNAMGETSVYNFKGKELAAFSLKRGELLLDSNGATAFVLDEELIKRQEGTIREISPEGDTLSTWAYPQEMGFVDRRWMLWKKYSMEDEILLVDGSYPGFAIADKSAEELTIVDVQDEEFAEIVTNTGGGQRGTGITQICNDNGKMFLVVLDRRVSRILQTNFDGEIEKVYEIPRSYFQPISLDVVFKGGKPRFYASGYKTDPETFEPSQGLVILEPGGEIYTSEELDDISAESLAAYKQRRASEAAKSDGKDIESLAKKMWGVKSIEGRISIYTEMLKLHPTEVRTAQMLGSFSYLREEDKVKKGQLNEIFGLVKKQIDSDSKIWNNAYNRDWFFRLAGNTKDPDVIIEASEFMLRQEPTFRSMRDVQQKAIEIGAWDVANEAAGRLLSLPEDPKYSGNLFPPDFKSAIKGLKNESRAAQAIVMANTGNQEAAITILRECLNQSAKNLAGVPIQTFDVSLADAYILVGKKDSALKVMLPGMLFGNTANRLVKFSKVFKELHPKALMVEYLDENRFKYAPQMKYNPYLTDLDKNAVDMKDYFGKKMTVIMVWLTAGINQDTYNKAIADPLSAIQTKYSGKGLSVVAIDIRNNAAAMKKLIDEGQINFTCLEADPDDPNSDWKQIGAYILDEKGRVLQFFSYEEVKSNSEGLQNALAKLMDEK